jgi:methyl-accepting chemotaxis protein
MRPLARLFSAKRPTLGTPQGNVTRSLASLTVRAAIFTVLTCSIPLLILGWYFGQQTTDSLTEAAVDRNNKVAERVASDIGLYVQAKKNFLTASSTKEEIRSLDPLAAQRYLIQVQPFYGSNDALFVADRNGNQLCRTDSAPLVNIRERDYFRAAAGGVVSFSDPVLSKVTGQLTILGAAPIYGAGSQVVGVVGANLSLLHLQTRIEAILAQNPGYAIILLDKNRVPLYNQNNPSSVEKQEPLPEALYAEAVKNRTGVATGILRNQEYLASYRPVDNTDWVVVSLYPQDKALEAIGATVRASLRVAFLLVAVFVFAGLIISRKTLAPLKDLEAGARTVSGGDLTVTVNNRRGDELGLVAAAFNSMTASLRELVQGVKESSSRLFNTAGSVSAAAGQASDAFQQVSQSIQDVAERITRQSDDTRKTEALLGELRAISAQVLNNSREVATATNQCSAVASQGQSVVDRALTQMTDIKKIAESTVANINSLGASTKEIDRITSMITSITKQTQLLALNASIEAARAGDAGRGFAVVAGEVQKLAEQSQEAVQSITAIISEVQGKTAEAVAAVQQSLAHIEEGAGTNGQLGAAFGHIIDAISKTQSQADEIAAASEQQLTCCQQAFDSVAAISRAAADNNATIHEIAAVSEEQAAAIQNIVYAISQLNSLSKNLDEMTGRFKA